MIRSARAARSSTASRKIASIEPSSQSRPIIGIARPMSVRPGASASRAPARLRPSGPSSISNRASMSAAVTSSTAIDGGSGAPSAMASAIAMVRSESSAAARSIASPVGRRRPTSPRPVAIAIVVRGAVASSASAHRAIPAA